MFKTIIALLILGITSTNIYSYQIHDIDGGILRFNDYQHKKILIVNTASNSRFKNQLASLELLYQSYKDSLIIIAVPSNSFQNELSNPEEIKLFIVNNFHPSYIIASKAVVTGEGMSPLYEWLTSANKNNVMSSQVTDDFQKYLIGSDGNLIGYFAPAIDPMDSLIQTAIQNY